MYELICGEAYPLSVDAALLVPESILVLGAVLVGSGGLVLGG